MLNSSTWPIDWALSDATTPGQGGSGSNGNEGVLHIPYSSSITGALPSDGLMAYPEHSLGWVLPLWWDAVRVQPQPTGPLLFLGTGYQFKK